MDFIQLQSYVAVIEHGSFSAAAKNLHMGHSTITNHVQRLEEELGCKLIIRSTRTLSITEKGQLFYRYAKQFLGSRTELDSALKNFNNDIGINICSTSNISFGLMPKLISIYRKNNDNVRFSLFQGQDHRVQALLGSGSIHVGFVEGKYTAKGITCVPLGSSQCKLLVPATDRFAAIPDKISDPYQLADEYPFLLPHTGEIVRTKMEAMWDDRFGSLQDFPRASLTISGIANAISFVQEGLGIFIAPNYVASKLSYLPMVRVVSLDSDDFFPFELHMIHHKEESDPATLDFIKFIKNWAYRNRACQDLAYFE